MNRRVLIGVMVAGVLLAFGALLVRVSAGGPGTAEPDTATATAVVPTTVGAPTDPTPPVQPSTLRVAGPADEVAVPVGFTADEAGAVAAAIAYATASQRWLYFSDDEITAAVAAVATPDAADRLTDEVMVEVAFARDELARSSGRVWWLVRPLATRVESHTDTSARVSVWLVTTLSATGVAVPQAEWLTVTVDLAWYDDGWRVDVVRNVSGPTPMHSPRDDPWPAARFDDALDGFVRVDGEPG